MRKLFETWATSNNLPITRNGYTYSNYKTHIAWASWQEAKNK